MCKCDSTSRVVVQLQLFSHVINHLLYAFLVRAKRIKERKRRMASGSGQRTQAVADIHSDSGPRTVKVSCLFLLALVSVSVHAARAKSHTWYAQHTTVGISGAAYKQSWDCDLWHMTTANIPGEIHKCYCI